MECLDVAYMTLQYQEEVKKRGSRDRGRGRKEEGRRKGGRERGREGGRDGRRKKGGRKEEERK